MSPLRGAVPNRTKRADARGGRLDSRLGLTLEAAGVVAILLGLVVIVLRLSTRGSATAMILEIGTGGMLAMAGSSFVLQQRGEWHHVVAARLLALVFGAPALFLLPLRAVPGNPAIALELTLPSTLLVLVVGVSLFLSLLRSHVELRLSLIGVLAAVAIAMATVMDAAGLVFGGHSVVLSPLPRLALVGLAILAAALLLDSVRRWLSIAGLPIRWLPAAVTLFLGVFAVGLWSSITVLEQGRTPTPLDVELSAIVISGGLVLAALAGLAIFLSQESLARLLDEARRLRASEQHYRELFARWARTALEESEARYHDLFEGIAVGVFQSTIDGELLLVNPALVEILGYGSPPEVLALDLLRDIYADPSERQPVIEMLQRTGEVRDQEIRLLRRDGSEIVGRLSARLLGRQKGQVEEIIAGTLVDVTEQKRLEERLNQSQKMDAIGQLAGGVAHDFNNLLTAIGGYAELALEHIAPGAAAHGEVSEIRRAAGRAAELTRQLLAFSRQQVLNPRIIELEELIADLQSLLHRSLGEEVELVTELAFDLGKVRMDPTQLGQVLLNLALNARDAMPGGGRLTIAAENVGAAVTADTTDHDGHRPAPAPERARTDARILLRVRDEGEGMDEKTRRRAVEPFFTTKPPGRGTGLGLSTVYGIVKQSGGTMEIESEPGNGTEVRIYLERAWGEVTPVREEAGSRRPAGPRERTILLVEDDSQVRKLLSDVLTSGGYDVRVAEGPEPALRLCADGLVPDLVVTDVVMPQLSGPNLAARLRDLLGEVRVLFISGYSRERIEGTVEIGGNVDYLSKPFAPNTLLETVRNLLERPA